MQLFHSWPFLQCVWQWGGVMWFSNRFAKKKSAVKGHCCEAHAETKQEQALKHQINTPKSDEKVSFIQF